MFLSKWVATSDFFFVLLQFSKKLLSCFNPSLTLKNNCFLLIFLLLKVDLFYYIVPQLLHDQKIMSYFSKLGMYNVNIFQSNVLFPWYFLCLEGSCFTITNGALSFLLHWCFIRKDTLSPLRAIFSLLKCSNKKV